MSAVLDGSYGNPEISSLYIPVVKKLSHHWMGRVTSSQFCILVFIADRTLDYGKLWERIPRNHFLTGVLRREDGISLHGGTGLSESTLWRSLAILESDDLVLCRRSENRSLANEYALNLDTIMGSNVSKLKTSSKKNEARASRGGLKESKKARQGTVKKTVGYCQNDSRGTVKMTVINSYKKNTLDIKPLPVAANARRTVEEEVSRSTESIEARAAAAAARYRSTRRERSTRAGTSLATKDIRAAWAEAVVRFAEGHGETLAAAPPTEKTCGVFRQNWKRYAQSFGATGDGATDMGGDASEAPNRRGGDQPDRPGTIRGGLASWFYRLLTSWDALRAGPLAWYGKMPRQPHFDFIAFNLRHLLRGMVDLVSATKTTTVQEELRQGAVPKTKTRRKYTGEKSSDVFAMLRGHLNASHENEEEKEADDE